MLTLANLDPKLPGCTDIFLVRFVPTLLATLIDPAPSLDPEFARVLRIADPGPALDGGLTFLPPAASRSDGWLRAWEAWRDTTLASHLAPVLMAATYEAARGRTREIQALDLALEESLEPAARERSQAAGRLFLQRLSRARGERWLGKLHTLAAAGQTPAHFATVYAAQNALFHLSLRLLLPAYAYWEWTAALATHPPTGGPGPTFARESHRLLPLAPSTIPDFFRDAAETLPPAAGAS